MTLRCLLNLWRFTLVDGVSYTEKEFNYAVSKGIPVLGFVIDPSVDPLAKHVDTEERKVAALATFKSKVKQRPVGFWKTAEELHGKVSIALMKAFNTSPRIGWTRANDVAGPEVMQELSRLSRENAEMRAALDLARKQEIVDRRAHLQSRIDTLKAITRVLSLREHGKSTWDIEVRLDLFTIYSQLAPEMMVECSLEEASKYLALMNNPSKETKLSANAPVPLNHVGLLFADLASIDLVEPSKKKHPVADKSSYWSLTQEGIDVLKLHRATGLEAAAAKVRAKDEALLKEIEGS